MADRQYDVSPKLVRLFEEKQKIREAVHRAVIKRQTNPHLAYGNPFDKAIIQYHSLWGYRNEHVRTNFKNVTVFFGAFVLPIALVFFDMVRHHNTKEKKLRSGQVAYADRCYKQVL